MKFASAAILAGVLLGQEVQTMAEDVPAASPKRKVLEDIRTTPNVSTLIESFVPALKAAGTDWSEAGVAGTFGHAFCFSMDKDGGGIMQTAAIDWWQFFVILKQLDHGGETFSGSLQGKDDLLSPQDMQALKDRAWKRVKASIDSGVPAVAWAPMTVEQKDAGANAWEWGLLVGYDEKEKTYTVCHGRSPKGFTVGYDKFGYTDDNQWFCVIVLGPAKTFDKKAFEVSSLRRALEFGKGTLKGSCDATAVGFEAYELWLKALQSGQANRNRAPVHAEFLRQSRALAAQYLREIAADFPDPCGRALLDAAACYGREADAAAKLSETCRGAKNAGLFNEPAVKEAVAALSAALAEERKAVAKIEEALGTLP